LANSTSHLPRIWTKLLRFVERIGNDDVYNKKNKKKVLKHKLIKFYSKPKLMKHILMDVIKEPHVELKRLMHAKGKLGGEDKSK